jgi:hypothetical protein
VRSGLEIFILVGDEYLTVVVLAFSVCEGVDPTVIVLGMGVALAFFVLDITRADDCTYVKLRCKVPVGIY